MSRALCSASVVAIATGCASAAPEDEPVESLDTASSAAIAAGASARGPVPTGLPSRMMVGLFEDSGQTWMKNSGVRWDARYRYFTKGWVDNWGWSERDGSWGLSYLRESTTQGFVPAVQYYQLWGEPGGGENETLAKVQNAGTMRSYFGDFKTLMQRVKDHGKPTMILIEADATGFLQQQTNSNPNAYAAIAASGMSELSGLPNTVAGFGLAFLQIKKAVGANNAVLGLHVSSWATGKEIAYHSVTDPLGPEVDKAYNFLAPLGLATNRTGLTYDVLVGDPLDRDSDYYRLVQGAGQSRWWNASDSASINSASFNRYAEWLRLFNVKASKRWVLWQLPLGNSNHLNVYNNGGAREGYKDNRVEYFFGTNSAAHLSKFADAGVVALLFGAGASGQSTYGTDLWTDGRSYIQTRAGAVLNSGGVTLGPAQCSFGVSSPGLGGAGSWAAGALVLGALLVARRRAHGSAEERPESA